MEPLRHVAPMNVSATHAPMNLPTLASPSPRSRRPRQAIWITAGALAVSVALTFFFFRGAGGTSFNIAALTLMNLNMVLVLVLALLLSRNLIKLYFERRQQQAGFKTKLVAAFLGLSLIPILLLSITASGLLTHNIENWFSVQVEASLDQSLAVAQGYYQDRQHAVARRTGRIAHLAERRGMIQASDAAWQAFADAVRREEGLLGVWRFTPDLRPIGPVPIPALPNGFLQRAARSANPVATIQSTPAGDLIRGAVPIMVDGRAAALLVLDDRIPSEWVSRMEGIKQAAEGYRRFRAFKEPIKRSYFLSFLIVALLILFSAIWFGFYLARGITVPIQKLAEGTRAVAQGNLDVYLDVRATDELGTLVGAFNKMTSDLRQGRDALIRAQKLATWQEVARQIAHEIKNPLTPIRLATERLRKKYSDRAPDFDQVFDDATRTIISEVDGLKTLVDAFSHFARMPAPKPTPQPLAPIIDETVALYQAGHKDVLFAVHHDPSAPRLHLDREQIKRVFVNLIENAVDAMGERGRIEIVSRYFPAEQRVRVTVSDDGVGMAEEDIEKIFLPYFSRKKSGTGLGLAIVHRIVSDHNAQIRAARRVPNGATFTLEFST